MWTWNHLLFCLELLYLIKLKSLAKLENQNTTKQENILCLSETCQCWTLVLEFWMSWLDTTCDGGDVSAWVPLMPKHPPWSKIDRFLVYPDWETQFTELKWKRLPKLAWIISLSFLIVEADLHGVGRYFIFENMWLKLEGIVDRVK